MKKAFPLLFAYIDDFFLPPCFRVGSVGLGFFIIYTPVLPLSSLFYAVELITPISSFPPPLLQILISLGLAGSG